MPRNRLAAGNKSLLGFIGLAILGAFFYALRPTDLAAHTAHIKAVAVSLLKVQGVYPARDLESESAQVSRSGRFHWRRVDQRYRVPSSFSWNAFRSSLESRLKSSHLNLLKAAQQSRTDSWIYLAEVGPPSLVLYRIVLVQPKQPAAVPAPGGVLPRGRGKIAMVLDDWGYSMRQVPALAAIHQPLTVSILPGLPHSAEVAKAAHADGHEVILHMPMEAQDPKAPREPATILTTMSKEVVLQHLDQSLASVPFIKGVNNHQGSKATMDSNLMNLVLGEIKRRNLYFIDSLVTQQSVCDSVARRLKLPFVRRAVFLDNEDNPAAIRKNLIRLAVVAQQKGEALGIGHDRPKTLQVLQEMVPALEQAGYQLVPASELAQIQN